MKLFLIWLFSLLNWTAAPPAPTAIVGHWLTADKQGTIQIYQQQGLFSGRITGPTKEIRYDTHNPDPQQRSRKLLGTVILQNFRYDGADAWEDGTIYDPNNGKTYSCTIKLRDPNTLEVRGYVGISLLGRTEVWTRLP